MTELQKISLKKLRNKKDPLFVLDHKSKKGGLVILDIDTYEKLSSEHPTQKESAQSKSKIKNINFKKQGLLWDHPEMTSEDFAERLTNKSHAEHLWAVGRLLERTPSTFSTSILSLDQLQEDLPNIKFRPFFKEVWHHAVNYWTQDGSTEEILCKKINLIQTRNEIEDYIDLFHLIPKFNMTVRELIDLANLKLGGGIDPVVLAYQTEFIFKQPPPSSHFLGKTNWQELQLFFGKFQK